MCPSLIMLHIFKKGGRTLMNVSSKNIRFYTTYQTLVHVEQAHGSDTKHHIPRDFVEGRGKGGRGRGEGVVTQSWKTAHPIGILLANASQY